MQYKKRMKRYVFPRNGSRLLYAVLLSVVTLFAACSDDDIDIVAEVEVPAETDLTQLERWSYTIPFAIKSDSEWQIETKGDFFYVIPDKGTGNATIKICLVDNDTDVRNNGELNIIFPKDKSKNQVIRIQQKSKADYSDNATTPDEGNKKWAVGYGYNASEGYADQFALRKAIFKMELLSSQGNFVKGTVSTKMKTESFTGSSINELSNKLTAKAGLSGGFGSFKGELTTTFNTEHFSQSKYEYVMNYHRLKNLNLLIDNLSNYELATDTVIGADGKPASKYILKGAYDAINGLVPKYGNSDAGIRALIEEYGTHVVMSAHLGGCVRYSMTIDISQITDSYDLNAYAAASYKGVVDANASVDNKFIESFKKNQKHCNIEVSIDGGSIDTSLELGNEGGFTQKNLLAWQKTVADNPTLVDFEEHSLVPLYELVDEKLYPRRKELLKQFMTGDGLRNMYKPINMEYNTGTVTHFKVPKFDGSKQDNTLIKRIYLGDQLVAKACEEYIPVINHSKRVTVIYPVLSNKTRWNMGYFIGDDNHKPAKVCWEGSVLTITEFANEKMGSKKELYARGSTFSTSSTDDIHEGRVEDEMILAPGRDVLNHPYPIVKIFNQIWMRDNYQGNRKEDGKPLVDDPTTLSCFYNGTDGSDEHTRNDAYYHSLYMQSYDFAPAGWRTSSIDDFLNIQKVLTDNDVTINGAKAFFPDNEGGFLGFHHRNNGYLKIGFMNISVKDKGTRGLYFCKKKDEKKTLDGFFEIGADESFGKLSSKGGVFTLVSARLVQDIE